MTTKSTFRHCDTLERNCGEKYTDITQNTDITQEYNASLKPVDGSLNDSYHYMYESLIDVHLRDSGIFTCEVCNLKNDVTNVTICDKQSSNVFLNEFNHGGFGIKTSKDLDNIIEDDEVNLTCFGSIYLFHKVVWFKRDKIEDNWKLGMLQYQKYKVSHIKYY